MSLDIYAENLMQHYEKQHNRGRLSDFDVKVHEENTTCGDSMDLYLKVDKGRVKDVSFEGIGCIISMGSASITTDFVKGKSLKEIEKMDARTVIDIIGVDPGPARIHCATLAMRAVKSAVLKYEGKEMDEKTREL